MRGMPLLGRTPLHSFCLPPTPPLPTATIANIPPRSPRLWAHAVLCWVLSFFIYYWLWK